MLAARQVWRELKRKVIEVYKRWQQLGKPTPLIEDAGSGASLIQGLREHKIPVIAIRPEGDKVMRMHANPVTWSLPDRRRYLLKARSDDRRCWCP
jgi:phage terminase large subunit-like protein